MVSEHMRQRKRWTLSSKKKKKMNVYFFFQVVLLKHEDKYQENTWYTVQESYAISKLIFASLRRKDLRLGFFLVS